MWKRNKQPAQPGSENPPIPDAARPFALVNGAREAYLNFLRNLTPPILLTAILMVVGYEMYQRWEGIGVFVFVILAITIFFSFYNNAVQLTIKIKESYAVEKLQHLPVRGHFEITLVLLIVMVCYSTVLVMGWETARKILEVRAVAETTTQQKPVSAPHLPPTKPTP